MKKIDGFPKYFATCDGKIWSTFRNKFLVSRPTNAGYHTVCLCNNPIQKRVTVHRIIALTFIPNPEGKDTVNHINGDKEDNRVDNLEWATYNEQELHAHKTGLKDFSNKDASHLVKLNREKSVLCESDIKNIKKLRMKKISPVDIASQYGVSYICIYDILSRKTWNHIHVDGEENYPKIPFTNGNNKLCKEDVLLIRKLHEEGVSRNELCDMFQVKPPCISKIILRQRWADI